MTDRIRTERLVLRPVVAEDAAVIMAGFADFEVIKWLARPPYPFTAADLRIHNDDGSSRWPEMAAIEHKGRMIGIVSGAPHLGFWLLQEAWGQGFATEAGRAMAALVFEETAVDHLVSGYFDGNTASANVLAKLGFVETGRGTHWCEPRREDIPHIDLRLDRSDWEARV
ncbi:MAG: GNAT family N-acetyltransferase [Pseudomonadota bacterium]